MKDMYTLWLLVSWFASSLGTPVVYHYVKCPSKSLGVHWLEIAGHHDFDYNEADEYGPDHWQCFWIKCQGPYQSPVDISAQGSVYYHGWGIRQTGLKAFRGKLTNNVNYLDSFDGWTIKLSGNVIMPGRLMSRDETKNTRRSLNDWFGCLGLYVPSTAKVIYAREKLRKKEKPGLYVRSTAKVIYGREQLRKKEKPGHALTFKLTEPGSILSTWTLRESIFTPVNCHYRLLQFHFHSSGPHGGKGSEHSLNGVHYDAEMHMVHFNTQYGSFVEAMDQPNGLAVLGVFLEATSRRMSSFDYFISLHEEALLYVNKEGQTCQFNPSLLFPKSNDLVYYRGSLTTPGCHETVNWFMMKNPVKIHPNTLRILRKMRAGNGEFITKYGDRRPMQRLMGRRLLTNFKVWT